MATTRRWHGQWPGDSSTPACGGLFRDMDDTSAHGQDERIGIESFYEGMEFLYPWVKALSGGAVS